MAKTVYFQAWQGKGTGQTGQYGQSGHSASLAGLYFLILDTFVRKSRLLSENHDFSDISDISDISDPG